MFLWVFLSKYFIKYVYRRHLDPMQRAAGGMVTAKVTPGRGPPLEVEDFFLQN